MQEPLETWVLSLGWEDLLEGEMATHPSVLAWRMPWTEEPGGLQYLTSQRAGRDLAAEHTQGTIRTRPAKEKTNEVITGIFFKKYLVWKIKYMFSTVKFKSR